MEAFANGEAGQGGAAALNCRWRCFWKLPLWIAMGVAILDQASKLLVLWRVAPDARHPVIDSFFHLVHYRNSGAAWGMFSGHALPLAILSMFILAFIVWKFPLLSEGLAERSLALSLVVGGTVGNLIDRLAYGEVVDFLLFFYRSFHWPAFNVADSAISVGVAIYIGSTFLRRQPEVPDDDQAGTAAPPP